MRATQNGNQSVATKMLFLFHTALQLSRHNTHSISSSSTITTATDTHYPVRNIRQHTARLHALTRAEMSSGPLSSPSPWPSPSSTASNARSSLVSSSKYSSSSSPVAVGYRTEQD
jgi:hypothetical protein